MSEVPKVKLTTAAAHKRSPLSDYITFYTNIWLKTVDKAGFDMCYREGVAYTGRHNLTVVCIFAVDL